MLNKKDVEVIKNNERGSFIFYRSFYEAINSLQKKNQLSLYTAIMEYSFNLNSVQLDGFEKAMFELIKPQLDANNKRYLNGCKPKSKQDKSKTEAKDKQNTSKEKAKISKIEANDNVNVNVNVNDNVNVNERRGKHSDTDTDFLFEVFWENYPRKYHKNDCRVFWDTLNIDESILDEIVQGIKYFLEGEWVGRQTKHIPSARTFLEDERWKDLKSVEQKKDFETPTMSADEQLLYFYEMGTTREEFLEKGTSVEKLDELEIYE